MIRSLGSPACLSCLVLTAISICTPALADPFVGQAYLHFDASASVLQQNPISTATPFTIEMWFRSAYQPPPYTYGYPQQDLIVNWNPRSYFLQLRNNALVFAQSADGTIDPNQLHDAYGATTIPYGEWTNVAVVHTASEIDLYVNGKLDGSVSTGQFPLQNGQQFTIGGYLAPGEGFTGDIDELRISNIARYTSNYQPQLNEFLPDSETLILDHFDEGFGSRTTNAAGTGDYATLAPGVTWGSGQAVPEPASLALFAVGALSLLIRRRLR